MNALAAAVLAAGELVCEFSDGYRKSLLADIAGDVPRTEMVLVFEQLTPHAAQGFSTRWPGRRPIAVYPTAEFVHLVQREGASVRVTTLTACTRGIGEHCSRFEARHAWHFDATVHVDADASFRRQPSGAATGTCEPWRVEP